ncbi:MAG: hypothetical protein H6Q23_1521, partial [Bacteroidetes bacterium]|nr:hypothetical protein [Bacteroidota bacterium]
MGKNKFTRREFVTTLAAGTGIVVLGKAVNAIPSEKKARMFDPLQT